jgi:cytochrome P450
MIGPPCSDKRVAGKRSDRRSARLWHLARTPTDSDRLIAESALMPTAIEEFLRASSPVTMAREVVKDTEIGGCPIKAGNIVLLSFPAASRIKAVISPLTALGELG